MNEFPKMLFRDGEMIDVNGLLLDTLIVDDADAETIALADGWRNELIAPIVDGVDAPAPRRGRPPRAG